MFRLAFVIGDLPTAGTDLVGQLLLRVASGLAELHEARTEAFGAGVKLLGHGGIRGEPLARVYPVFVHDGCPVLEHDLGSTIFVHIAVTTFRHEKSGRRGLTGFGPETVMRASPSPESTLLPVLPAGDGIEVVSPDEARFMRGPRAYRMSGLAPDAIRTPINQCC